MHIRLLLSVLLVYGCAGTPMEDSAIRHETSESQLLTEQEFMERASQSAALIYEGFDSISRAAGQYAMDNDGRLPAGLPKAVKALLLERGYLERWPVLPPFAFANPVDYPFVYSNGYDDMDGIGAKDDAISAQELKLEVCEAFVSRYTSFGPGDIIHDFKADGGKYPGELDGRHIKVFAIIWQYEIQPESCEIIWVMQYND